MTELTVKNWFGSLTDFYMGADPSSYALADNFYVDSFGKLNSRPGTELDFAASMARARAPESVNTRRIGLMVPQTTGTARNFTIVKQVGEKLHYDNGTAMTELVGPASASAFDLSTPIDAETVFSYAEWNNHSFVTHESPFQRPVMMYNDSGGTLRLRTAGLPKPVTGFTATGGSGANYIYALVHKYSYTVGSIDYVLRSAPQYSEFTNIGSATASANPGITVGSIPVLANADGQHYDTANISVEVYRTTNNGTVFYLAGAVVNGVTSIADSTSDNDLIEGVPLYTMDGSAENDRPPTCKYMHGTSDFVYYAHATEVGVASQDLELQPQRLYQSKRGNPNAVPATFYADMEEPITGISSVKSIPIVFCENSIYRIDNFYDDLGRGGMVAKKISDRNGAIGHLSLVQTLDGIFFAGNDGFYFTDGYTVVPLNENISTSYKDLVDTALKRKRICGAYDSNENRIMWATHSTKESEADNAKMYVVEGKSKTMTTWSSGYDGRPYKYRGNASAASDQVTLTDTTGIDAGDRIIFTGSGASIATINAYVLSVDSPTVVTISHDVGTFSAVDCEVVEQSRTSELYANFRPSSLLFANRELWMGNQLGFTLRFDDELPNDPWLNPGVSDIGDMSTTPIYFNYDGVAMDMGESGKRKWVNQIIVKARPRSDVTANISVEVNFENDDSGNEFSLQPIFLAGFPRWGSLVYGDPALWRRISTILNARRRFPAGTLRCQYRQIGLTIGYVVVFRSGTQSTATVTAGPNYISKTVTIVGDVLRNDVENLYFAIESDEYVGEYKIVEQLTDTSFVVMDLEDDLALQSAQKWVMRGYPKNALINLLEYTILYETLGPSQTPYQGENAITQ